MTAPPQGAGDALRSELIEAFRQGLSDGSWWITAEPEQIADAVISGPLAPVLAACATAEAERDKARADLKAAEDANDALNEKLSALAPHGSCACSYDQPGDVCLHHSPALVVAEDNLSALAKMYGEVCGELQTLRLLMTDVAAEADAANDATEAHGDALDEEIDLHNEAVARALDAESRVAALTADRDRPQDRAEAQEEALVRIVQWSEAYPTGVFTPPDYPAIRKTLEADGFVPGHTLDGIAADCLRKATEGVGKIARAALSSPSHPESADADRT